jgi:hypothetical protein
MATCSLCGTVAGPGDGDVDDGVPLGWMVELDGRRGRVAVCPACAREHVRSIEGKLDQAWW